MRQIPIEELDIAPGYAVEWSVVSPTRGGAAEPTQTPPVASYIQEQHFALAQYLEGEEISCPSYIGGSFEIRGRLDRDALGAALLHFVRRHEVLRCVFRTTDDGPAIELLAPEEIKVDLVEVGQLASTADVRSYVHRFLQGTHTLRGPWFVMGAMIRDESTTVYFACDHLVTDGVSTPVVVEDISTAYEAFSRGEEVVLPEVGSYLDFAVQERDRGRSLTPDDSRLDYWKGFTARNGGMFPRFPLDLGVEPGVMYPVINETYPLLGGHDADAMELRCREAGSELAAGVLAAVAVTLRKEGGPEVYRGLMPVSRRGRGKYANSMGWFVNTLPVEFSVAGEKDFAETIGAVRTALVAMLKSANVPFPKVFDLMPSQHAGPQGWPFPINFFSYLDFGKTPGAGSQVARKACGHIWGSHSNGIFFWFYRNDTGLYLNAAFPDTPQARRTAKEFLGTLGTTMDNIIGNGTF
ncbi:condensation domain-containing protein [Nocardiopsis ansamitocini]|uniref:Condensation domain-containing protein n=1 Tax=Nocardiopsis ansamitocini TaxID=1670832 RepID=A0A9W6P8K1_9ACTN|nr:condensation domain-containing protein [Nocardiopsis ansamitocini]GLU48981.1 hypothetical protein Nans01_33320 [Nocardiopsis ansamitocini]